MADDLLPPQKREYHLRCKVLIKNIQVEDLGKVFEREVVLLIPETNDQGMNFYSAWLPKEKDDFVEIGMLIENFGLCRGASIRANKNYIGPHIHVMSVGVRDDFIKQKFNGQTVSIKTLSEDAEEILDQTRETDGSYDIIEK